MAVFSVDSMQVADAGVATQAQAEKIRADVGAMLAHLQSLQGTWTGAAAASFANCVAQWQVAQAQVEEALRAISAELAHAASTYQQAEDQAAALFAAR